MGRKLKYFEAIREALDQSMSGDPSVYLIGLGVPDPKGIFGTTLGLEKKYGKDRVMDMPISENGMTGFAIGTAISGMKPVMVHQRLDFAILAVEQIVNQAAKWHYMFAGTQTVPLVIRLVVGRGWGQGPQHSQSLHSWFAHIPGLKVVMPATPADAKGLLLSSIEDLNPVLFIEHRWLHNTFGDVPEAYYKTPLGKARVMKEGKDITLIGVSHMSIEALKAAQILAKQGIDAEVIDVRTVKPLDSETLFASVRKTGRVIVMDPSWMSCGIGAEILARITETEFKSLKSSPKRIGYPDCPVPTSPALAYHFYPTVRDVVTQVCAMLQKKNVPADLPEFQYSKFLDVPDNQFTGPF